MAIKFYDKATFVDVSHFDDDGYWTGNENIHVQKGTGVPYRSTEIIYNPSAKGKVGKFDRSSNTWSEVDTHHGTEYWDELGNKFIHKSHLEPMPQHAILDKPPVMKDNHVAYFNRNENKWVTHESRIGKTVFSSDGSCRVIETTYYTPAPFETFDPKPKRAAKKGHVWHVVNSKWVEEEYHHDKKVFHKANGNTETLIYHHGTIPDHLTDKKPPSDHHTKWNEDTNSWELDMASKKKADDLEEKSWVNSEISKVKDELLEHYILTTFSSNTSNIKKPDETFKYYNDLIQYKASADMEKSKRPVKS